MIVFNIIENLLKRSLYRKYSMFIYIFLPVLAITISLFLYSGNLKANISINIKGNTFIESEIIEIIEKNFNVIYLEKNLINKNIIDDKISGFLELPENIESKILNSEEIKIDFTIKRNSEDIVILKNNINIFLNTLKKITSSKSLDIETLKMILEKEEIKYIENNNENKSSVIVSSIGFIIIFNLIIYTNNLSSIIRDKKNLIWNKIKISDLKISQYIKGQLGFNFIIAMIQLIVILIFINIFNFDLGISNFKFSVTFLLLYLISISIGLFIISFCKKEEQISLFSTIIIFPSCMLSGCLWPVDIMNETLQKISYFFPQRYIYLFLENIKANNNLYILNASIIILISMLLIYYSSLSIERR